MKNKFTFTSLFFLFTTALFADVSVPAKMEPFFKQYCYDCHDGQTQKGDFDLQNLNRKISTTADAENWQNIVDVLNTGEMPPKSKRKKIPQPSENELATAIGDMTEVLFKAQSQFQDSRGKAVLRRLNRREYQATIKDLMGINFDTENLPDDAKGRFDTIGQDQSLSAIQLRNYFSIAQEIVQTSLFWAKKPREKSEVLHASAANSEGKNKRIYEVRELIKRIKKTGEDYRQLGISKKEWDLLNPGQAGYKNRTMYARHYINNVDYHSQGHMLPLEDLVPGTNIKFYKDARATYRVRAQAGVLDGVKTRRVIRLAIPHKGLSGRNGKFIGSYYVNGSIDKSSVHEITFRPEIPLNFRPEKKTKKLQFISLHEDKRGGPGVAVHYPTYKHIEPGVPTDTILVKWTELEGPIYEPKSAFENLVDKYKLATASDKELDSIATKFLSEFAHAALRGRSLESDFIKGLNDFYDKERKQGKNFQQAIVDPLAMILSSSQFLYLLDPATQEQMKAQKLANRLSYFLWSSPPDAQLQKIVNEGKLFNKKIFLQEVDRMLDSPKAEPFFSGFMYQWMHLQRLEGVSLSSKLLLDWSDALIGAAKQEPIEFFKEIVRSDLCASNLIDSDFIMANGVLAMKYGLIDHYSGSGFQKIKLPKDSPRGGIMTQTAFLSMGTMGNRTSPIIRGALVKEILLNNPPPPPPPNVPELVVEGVDPLSSVRSLVELHQKQTQCASCHARFDFIGLGLENFDAIGIWRDKELVTLAEEAHQIRKRPKKFYPVDASGELPNGTKFNDIYGLKAALMKDKRQVAASLFEGLLCYALGRNASFTDRPFIEKSLNFYERKEKDRAHYSVRNMIKQIVINKAFWDN